MKLTSFSRFSTSYESAKDAAWMPYAFGIGCSLVIISTASSLLCQAGWLDPFVYAAYVNDYSGTYQRFGQTYYSSRVAYIFLDRAFIGVFGQVAGLFLCRVTMFAAAATAAFQIARRYFGCETAMLSVAWLCFIPWLLRSLLWTHYDGFAVVYLLVSFAFLLVPTSHRFWGHVAAGVSFSLAVNCNLLLILIGGAFGPSWLILNRREDIRSLLVLALGVLSGFFIGYSMLQIVFSITIGSFTTFLESATISASHSLLGGVLANWFVPLHELIHLGNFLFLVPIFFCIFGSLATVVSFRSMGMSQRNFVVAATVYGVLLLAIAFVFHYFFSHAWLSLFYYEVYFVPSCLLILISVGGITSHQIPKAMRWISYGTITILFLLWVTRHNIDILIPADIRVWLLFALATLIVALIRPRLSSGPVFLGALLIATCGIIQWSASTSFQWSASTSRSYELTPGARGCRWSNENDVYNGAIYLQSFISARVPASAAIGFWYSDKPEDKYLNSIQSMFLWGYTRLFLSPGPSMPNVDEKFRSLVKQKEYIGLLATTQHEIDLGLEALKNVPINYREVARAVYPGEPFHYFVALAKLQPVLVELKGLIEEIKLNSLIAQNGANVVSARAGLSFTTAACQWCYSLTAKISAAAKSPRPQSVVMRVRLTLFEGKVGIAVANVANASELLNRVSVSLRSDIQDSSKPDLQTIDLKIESFDRVGQIIIINESPNGPSRGLINSIEFYESQ